MTRAAIALAAALAAVAIVLAVVLSGSPLVVVHTNAVPADEPISEGKGNAGACQEGELLPAGVSAIRLTLVTLAGPSVSVSVSAGERTLASGTTGSGWTAGAVTVPVRPLAHAVAGTRICFALGRSVESVTYGGSHTSPAIAARTPSGTRLPGRFTVEYMRRGARSWWSLALPVARRIGLGKAPAGTWVALLLALAMAAVCAGAACLVVKELR